MDSCAIKSHKVYIKKNVQSKAKELSDDIYLQEIGCKFMRSITSEKSLMYNVNGHAVYQMFACEP